MQHTFLASNPISLWAYGNFSVLHARQRPWETMRLGIQRQYLHEERSGMANRKIKVARQIYRLVKCKVEIIAEDELRWICRSAARSLVDGSPFKRSCAAA